MMMSKGFWIDERGRPFITVVLLSLGLAACGGSTPPAESAAPEEAPASGAPTEPAVDETTEPSSSAEPAAPNEADSEASEPVSVQTFQNALQQVIGDPALLEAIGHDPSSNKPVLISGKDLPDGLERAAVVRQVEVVPLTDKPGKRTILLFTRIELDEKRGTFKYRCEATGAYGTTTVAYEGGSWQLKASRISTR